MWQGIFCEVGFGGIYISEFWWGLCCKDAQVIAVGCRQERYKYVYTYAWGGLHGLCTICMSKEEALVV